MPPLWHLGVNFYELGGTLTGIAVVEQDDGAAQSLRAPGASPLTFRAWRTRRALVLIRRSHRDVRDQRSISSGANAVRLQLHALACNLANFLRTLATPHAVTTWSLASLRERLKEHEHVEHHHLPRRAGRQHVLARDRRVVRQAPRSRPARHNAHAQ
jgi:hypothetical protein